MNPVGAVGVETVAERETDSAGTHDPRVPAHEAEPPPSYLADSERVRALTQAASAETAQTEAVTDEPQTAQDVFNENLRRATQLMRTEINEEARDEQFSERAADIALRVSGTTFSLGSLAWLLRGGSLFASALSAIPTWKGFDPLPVLAKAKRSRKKKKRDQKEEAQCDENETEAHVGRVLDALDGSNSTDLKNRDREDRT